MSNYEVKFQRCGSNVTVYVSTNNGSQVARQIAESQKPEGYSFASITQK